MLSSRASSLNLAPRRSDFDPDRQTPKERQLIGGFTAMLAGISFTDILHMADDENGNPRKVPRTIDRYRLVPLTPRRLFHEKTVMSTGYECNVPKGIFPEYPRHCSKNPYLDTKLGIGLAYGDRLVAAAGACLDIVRIQRQPTEAIYIKQLQAVHAPPAEPKDTYKTGLHAGILWRDTLVEAWSDIGRQLELGHVIVQTAAKNTWTSESTEGYDRFVQAYDGTAERMGFTQLLNRNWHKPLVEREAIRPA